MFIYFIAFILFVETAFADENIFNEYTKDIHTDAEVKLTRKHSARADNLRYRIKHNLSKGMIIKNDAESGYESLFGITIEKNANTGPIVMDTEIGNNTTIIIENDKKY